MRPPTGRRVGGLRVFLPARPDVTVAAAVSFDPSTDRAVQRAGDDLSFPEVIRQISSPSPDTHPGLLLSCPPAAGRVWLFRARRQPPSAAGSRTGLYRRPTAQPSALPSPTCTVR